MVDNVTAPVTGEKFKTKDTGANGHMAGHVLYDEAEAEVLGKVTASPTANTVLGRLKDLLTGTVLAAGTNAIGKLAANAGVTIGAVEVAAAQTLATVTTVGTVTTVSTVTAVTGITNALPVGANVIGKVSIDQATPGTTDRVTTGGIKIVDVTLSTDTSVYASGDLIAETQQVDAALRVADGYGILHSLVVIDEDDQGVALDVYFLSANNSFGSENSAPSISDASARDILCRISVTVADYADLGGVKVAELSGLNRIVKAVSGTDDLYVAVVNGTGAPTYTSTGLKLRIGIIQQ